LFTAFICCCFGGVIFADVGFVVGACCIDGDGDTADAFGVFADDVFDFTVRGIPHIRDSVALTTFRLGLVGSHIFALSSGDTDLLEELPVGGDAADNVGEDEGDC
jgi:hypothetical protein